MLLARPPPFGQNLLDFVACWSFFRASLRQIRASCSWPSNSYHGLEQFDSDSEILTSWSSSLSPSRWKFGASAYPPRRSRAVSPASRRSSLTSPRFRATIVWVMAFLTCARLCLPLSDDLDSKNFSFREVRCSHQPVSSDFLIEINGCVLLQSNSENVHGNVIQDALRLTLSHVEIVIQCLLSKLPRKFSINIVFEALDDVVHCELRHILCAEVRFHNDLRLSMQSSSIQPWSQSFMIFHFVPLSKLFVDTAIESWHMLFFSAVNCT